MAAEWPFDITWLADCSNTGSNQVSRLHMPVPDMYIIYIYIYTCVYIYIFFIMHIVIYIYIYMHVCTVHVYTHVTYMISDVAEHDTVSWHWSVPSVK